MSNNAGLPVLQYTGTGLVPKLLTGVELRRQVQLPANVSYPIGTVLGQIVSGSSNLIADQQTITIGGTPTGGTFPLTFSNGTTSATATVPFNAPATGAGSLQKLLEALPNIGVGNVFCTGGPLPGSTIVVNFVGALAGAQALMTGSTTGLTGGAPTFAIAHTTTGTNTASGTATNDTQTLQLTGTPTGGGVYLQFAGQQTAIINYNDSVAQVLAKLAALTNIGTGNITVSGAGALPGNVLTISFIGQCAGLEQPLFTAINVLTGGTAPTVIVNHTIIGSSPTGHYAAYTQAGADGRQIAQCVLEYPCSTDSYGNVTFGTVVNTGDFGYSLLLANAWFTGVFDTSELSGIDSTAVTQLGRIITGNTNTLATVGTLLSIR